MCQKLANLQIDLLQVSLPRWCRYGSRGDAIKRTFYFDGFGQACGFMALVSCKAREMKHTLKWSANGSAVQLMLGSEAVQGLSDFDLVLARFADDTFIRCRQASDDLILGVNDAWADIPR